MTATRTVLQLLIVCRELSLMVLFPVLTSHLVGRKWSVCRRLMEDIDPHERLGRQALPVERHRLGYSIMMPEEVFIELMNKNRGASKMRVPL